MLLFWSLYCPVIRKIEQQVTLWSRYFPLNWLFSVAIESVRLWPLTIISRVCRSADLFGMKRVQSELFPISYKVLRTRFQVRTTSQMSWSRIFWPAHHVTFRWHCNSIQRDKERGGGPSWVCFLSVLMKEKKLDFCFYFARLHLLLLPCLSIDVCAPSLGFDFFSPHVTFHELIAYLDWHALSSVFTFHSVGRFSKH